MLEEVIKLYRFAGISPEQFFTEARSHREAVVAADQRMVIRCFRDDFSGFVHDGFHVTPPIQRAISAAAMVRNLSNLVPALDVPTHEDHDFRIRHAPRRAPPLCAGSTPWITQHNFVPDRNATRKPDGANILNVCRRAFPPLFSLAQRTPAPTSLETVSGARLRALSLRQRHTTDSRASVRHDEGPHGSDTLPHQNASKSSCRDGSFGSGL
jgi:hypothetical protein